MSNNNVMLEVKDLNKKFGTVHAVKNLSFEVKKGEVLGFRDPTALEKPQPCA